MCPEYDLGFPSLRLTLQKETIQSLSLLTNWPLSRSVYRQPVVRRSLQPMFYSFHFWLVFRTVSGLRRLTLRHWWDDRTVWYNFSLSTPMNQSYTSLLPSSFEVSLHYKLNVKVPKVTLLIHRLCVSIAYMMSILSLTSPTKTLGLTLHSGVDVSGATVLTPV